MLSDGGVTPPSPFLLIKNPAQKQCFWLKITLSGGKSCVGVKFYGIVKKEKILSILAGEEGDTPPQQTNN